MEERGNLVMPLDIIKSRDVYNIIRKTLGIMDINIMKHGEITGYILYKMLQTEGSYSHQELAGYAMLGIMHDIGMIKTGYEEDLFRAEFQNVWAHSIYGYLFLRYLSPIGEQAEAVLYHHLPVNRHCLIQSKYLTIAKYLAVADKMELYLQMKQNGQETEYLLERIKKDCDPRARQLYGKAQLQYNILGKIMSGEYEQELGELVMNAHFSEAHKKGYLEMLIYAIDFRSQQTVLHTLTTTTFATEIGRVMRCSEHELMVLYYGALLHDIGKIAIPLNILESPNRLSESEMKIMKAHVLMTKKILCGIIGDEILEVAVRHHEKLDGSGYPRGLKGQELTKLQRITAVADILSALYGKRSYKESFDTDTIQKIIRQDAENGKICPNVVAEVLMNFRMIFDNYTKRREDTMGIYTTILEQYDQIYEKFRIFE